MRSPLARRLFILIALGVATRLALVAAGRPPAPSEYDELARGLLAGHGYVYEHLGTPYRSFYSGVPYILLTAATYRLFPAHPSAMLLVHALCAAGLALVIFVIARRVTGERSALLAAALVLFHPALVYYDTHKLHPLGFNALTIGGAVWLLLRLRVETRMSLAIAAGAAVGLSILQRGSTGLFFACSLIWIARHIVRRPGGQSAAAVYVAGVLLVVLPWIARNYAIHGILMLESTTPQQFWKGNAAHSEGSAYLPSGRTVFDEAPQRLVNEWETRDETGQYRLFRDESVAEVRRNPGRVAGLVLRKFVYFWTYAPQSGVLYPARYFDVYIVYYFAMLALSVVGFATLWRQPARRPDLALILILLASVAVVHSVFFIEMRHRWAIEPFVLLLAAAGPSIHSGRAGAVSRNLKPGT